MIDTRALRLMLCAPLAFPACASAPPPGDPPAVDWIKRQYFGDRTEIDLPDLTAPSGVKIRIWKPGPAPIPGSPPNYRDSATPLEPYQYYPFLRYASYGAEGPTAYTLGHADMILDNGADAVAGMVRVSASPFNYLVLNAVLDSEIGRLTAAARTRKWDIAYSTPHCLVVGLRGPHPHQLVTNAYIGGDGERWDMNDATTERCALAGVLQHFGMNLPYVMKRVDLLYPHHTSSKPCPLVWAFPGAATVPFETFALFPCISRARTAMPFAVLRRAFEGGKLKAGKIDRARFAAALTAASNEVGKQVWEKIAKNEDSRLSEADRPVLPPIMPPPPSRK